MKEIPLKAKVQCTDGDCGKSTNVLIDRNTHQVSHVAIHDKKLPDNPTRMVPIENVAGATHDEITLNCTREELAHMDPFVVTQVIQQTGSGAAFSGDVPSQFVLNNTGYDTIDAENVPAGEIALSPGMKIKATDHTVGKLDEFALDPKTGAITHLLMSEGHLWGKKIVAVPVSNVDFTDGDAIYLTIDKHAVEALPPVPVNRKER